ncbi:VOC family protein [Herbaspirillum lusitanum]|uniref:VOC family protein n=1 Tax=Herbaspirillum lusitanum TaxID=213312 RepID=A0ABW9ABK6_9BURK
MQKITPFLWFDGQAQQAAEHYVSIFHNSRIAQISHYGEVGPAPKGSVMAVIFELEGQEFIALNGGPGFKFNQAVSLFVRCEDQMEVDVMWERLSVGGETSMCGWLKDRFGLSWQVVPNLLWEMLQDKNALKSQRVMQAMMQMKKIEIAGLQQAYDAV